MPDAITLLHTAASHIDGFERLLGALAPGASARHEVREDLLELACRLGVDHPQVIAQVATAVQHAAGADGAAFVLCTCSTIGGIAEQAGRAAGLRVLRVDRPMAEQAVRAGRRVLVLAAVDSTLAPTTILLREAAASAGVQMDLRTLLCEGAWALFETGRTQDYLRAVADVVTTLADEADVIVLAQASMAAAADLCASEPPVLSSPRSGLAAALAASGY